MTGRKTAGRATAVATTTPSSELTGKQSAHVSPVPHAARAPSPVTTAPSAAPASAQMGSAKEERPVRVSRLQALESAPNRVLRRGNAAGESAATAYASPRSAFLSGGGVVEACHSAAPGPTGKSPFVTRSLRPASRSRDARKTNEVGFSSRRRTERLGPAVVDRAESATVLKQNTVPKTIDDGD
jgi:hypothetical protein